MLLGGEDSGLELVEVAHRFDGHEVRAGRRAEAHLLGEGVVGGVELEVAGGLEEPSGGTDVERDKSPSAGARGGLLGDGDRGGYHVGERRVAVVLGGVGAEGVGVDDVRPGGEVGFVHGAHVVWPREVPELGHLARLQSPRLELRPHRPVEEQYAVLSYVDHPSVYFGAVVRHANVICHVLYHNFRRQDGFAADPGTPHESFRRLKN